MPISLRLVLALAIGAGAGVSVGGDAMRLLAAGAVGLALAALSAEAAGHRGLAREFLTVSVGLAAACHGAGAVARVERGDLRRWFDARLGAVDGHVDAERLEEPVGLRGHFTRDATPGDEGIRLEVAVEALREGDEWRPVRGHVGLTVAGTLAEERAAAWRAGRPLETSALLRRPARYLNRGVPDGERVLARRGVALVGSVKSAALVEVAGPGAVWDEWAARVRAAVRRSMARHVAPHAATSGAIGTAILIGDRAQMTPELERRLQEAGTYHVVAISGGNVALLASAVLAGLWIVGIRFSGAAGIAILVLVAHAWVIGGGASVVRATLMAVTYLALKLIDQRTVPVHALAVGAAVMLVASPLDVVNAGFWLTVGATGALLAAGARLPGGGHRRRWWHAALVIVTGSIAVELVLAPVSALVFQRATLAGVGLNLVAVPAMATVQGAATLCSLADAAGFERVASRAGGVVHLAARALVDSSALVDVVPWAVWRVPSPALSMLALYYLALVAWWRLSVPPIDTLRRRQAARMSGLITLALWASMVVSPGTLAPRASSRMRVAMLDVGQGDATLVSFPDGTTMLVDAGGLPGGTRFDMGERVVGPALRSRGVRRLDYLVITHTDADHAGGASSVLRDFGPREVWVGISVPPDPVEQELRAAASRTRSAWRWLRAGHRLAIGEAEVVVHHPPEPDWERRRVRNDDSVVLEVRLGEVSVLLTGDVTRAVEPQLAARLDAHRTVVLKAPHHGSATSSSPALVGRARPAVVLASAGRGNPFGHPAPAVIARYRALGAEVFRTDRDGQIEVATDGRSLEVTTFTGRRWRLR